VLPVVPVLTTLLVTPKDMPQAGSGPMIGRSDTILDR
jgi:hypothetical protein